MLNDKLNDLIKTKVSDLHERGDFWHPDPAQDRKLGGPGANQRAREDAADRAKPKEDPKKLRPGESYMDWNKRQQANRMKSESAVPGKPAERLGAVTAIPQSERDAAKARLLAKTAAKRKEMEKVKEELEIEEGKQAFPLKKVEKKMNAVRKETGYNKPGNPPVPQVSPSEMSARNRLHKLSAAHAKAKRAKQEADAASRSSTFYRDTHPTSQAKMKKANESLSFSQFVESRRMDREGVDRNDTARKNRTMAAKASVAAVQKRQAVLDKHEKKTGTKLDISRSREGQAHAKNFPGSRQQPKERGKKETPLQTHNRQVNRQVDRIVKHGYTSKEKKEAEAMAKHTSARD